MLFEEAEWIGEQIEQILSSENVKTVLNIGSSTSYAWKLKQPHINKFIFDKLNKSNIRVYNTDIKDVEGVDFVGDLYDDNFISELAEKKMGLIICANVLEHVKDPVTIALNIERLIHKNCYAIITVPHIYPYHPDPDDYLFRPGVNELKNLFNGMDCVSASIVKGRSAMLKREKRKYFKNYASVLIYDIRLLMLTLIRLVTPFYKYKNWKKTSSYLPFLFKRFSVTCAVFMKR